MASGDVGATQLSAPTVSASVTDWESNDPGRRLPVAALLDAGLDPQRAQEFSVTPRFSQRMKYQYTVCHGGGR
ncbi:hypothetical protein A8711_18860 [Micromonospora sp. II]|nr:hypothetical protein A8711_18860 [Micromonospora sp. II]